MKNIIAITVIAVSLFSRAFAFGGSHVLPFSKSRVFAFSASEVDEKVVQRFNAKYMGASSVTWEKTEDYSKVSFIWKGSVMSSFFDDQGDWLATAQTIKWDELPEGAIEAIKRKYKGYDLQMAVQLDRPYHKQPSFYAFVANGEKRILLELRAKGWIRWANQTYF